MVILRMYLLERIFTQKELVSLDDVVPSFSAVMSPLNKLRHSQQMSPPNEEELQTLKTKRQRNGSSRQNSVRN